MAFSWVLGIQTQVLMLAHSRHTVATAIPGGGVCDATASVWDRLPKPMASYGNARGCENSISSSPARPLRDKVLCVPCCQAQESVAGAASTALEPHSPPRASGLVSPVLRAAGVSVDIGRENIWNGHECTFARVCTRLGQGP